MPRIEVLKPTFDQQTKDDLIAVLDSGWVGQGPKTAELEAKFAKKAGFKYAVATNSCTAALDLVLKAKGVTEGRLVTPAFTFVADAIVGEWNGLAVEFGDIEPDTYCLEAKAYANPEVIIAVNSHGRLANIPRLREYNPYSLIIEDCAHCVPGGTAGTRGDIAVWSFQAVKVIPAGDGGMITTNDEKLAIKLKNMTWLGVEKSTYQRNTGKKYSWDYDITHGGTKCYMNDINAVLVLGNLRRSDELIAKRMRIQSLYNRSFKDLPGVIIPAWSPSCQYYTLQVQNRDKISDYLAEAGITTSVHFKPLSEMTYWKKAKVNPLPWTDLIWPKLLSLPCHDALGDEEQEHVIAKFKEALENLS